MSRAASESGSDGAASSIPCCGTGCSPSSTSHTRTRDSGRDSARGSASCTARRAAAVRALIDLGAHLGQGHQPGAKHRIEVCDRIRSRRRVPALQPPSHRWTSKLAASKHAGVHRVATRNAGARPLKLIFLPMPRTLL
jgi:hypothetical protein